MYKCELIKCIYVYVTLDLTKSDIHVTMDVSLINRIDISLNQGT